MIDNPEGSRIDVWMMKEYGVEESWTKFCVDGIPDRFDSVGTFLESLVSPADPNLFGIDIVVVVSLTSISLFGVFYEEISKGYNGMISSLFNFNQRYQLRAFRRKSSSSSVGNTKISYGAI
ncbi:hypothetical protein FXO38_36714 [Capsicum annuum]|nr:hypothetical protein FXO38_36714 [Capsicum annuum]KAF3623763.1 hypothetical protein FXO37_31712 [Capsicum annuum]